MENRIEITREEKAHVHVFHITGRIDAASAPLLEEQILPLLQEAATTLLLDMQGVNYLSSAGMRVMLSATKKLALTQGQCVFSGLNEEIMETIKMAGFEKILHIFPTESAALANLAKK